jgi:hypothetical protein
MEILGDKPAEEKPEKEPSADKVEPSTKQEKKKKKKSKKHKKKPMEDKSHLLTPEEQHHQVESNHTLSKADLVPTPDQQAVPQGSREAGTKEEKKTEEDVQLSREAKSSTEKKVVESDQEEEESKK